MIARLLLGCAFVWACWSLDWAHYIVAVLVLLGWSMLSDRR